MRVDLHQPSGVEEVITVDLKYIAMQCVGSRNELVRGCALPQTILCRKNRARDIKLVHHLKRRIDVGLKPLRLRLHRRNSLEQNLIGKVFATTDAMTKLASLHARCQEEE